MQIHIYGQISVASWPNLKIFVLWDETKLPEETQAGKEKTCNLEPRSFLLWGDSDNHYNTTPPLSFSVI